MKKALIIGSEGNVGRPLSRYLQQLGYEVLNSDIKQAWRKNYIMADICNPSDLVPAFDWKPDVVFFLAAMVSRVTCEQASSLAVQTNLAGVQNILDMSKRAGSRVIYFSTSEVYGPDMEVMSEDSIPRPNNRYGLTKLLSESLVKYEAEQYGLEAVILRPFMMYDENEDFGDHRSAMIRFAYNLALKRPIEVHSGSLRSWMHVADAVRVIAAAAACELSSCVTINIGNDDLRSIESLAAMLCNELGADPTLITSTPLPQRMTRIKVPDLQRQSKILKIRPEVTLEMGVKLVAARIRYRISAGMLYDNKTNRDDNYNSLLPFDNLARLSA